MAHALHGKMEQHLIVMLEMAQFLLEEEMAMEKFLLLEQMLLEILLVGAGVPGGKRDGINGAGGTLICFSKNILGNRKNRSMW